MSTVQFILWWVAPIIAIVYVVGYSSLFHSVRSWSRWPRVIADLLDCPMCIGFWAGAFVGFINWLPVMWPAWMQHMALGGCLAICAEYLLEVFARE